MNRFREALYIHWKAARWIVAPFVVVCFGLPMMVMRMIQELPDGYAMTAQAFLQHQKNTVALFPLLAIVTGGALALTAWSWEHQARHVYALSLPVSRARYVLTKYGAGLTLLMIPVAALLAGTLLALAFTKVPAELHSYPFSFAARFLMAVLISYSLVFSLAASTMKTTVSIIVAVVVIVVFGSMMTSLVNARSPRMHLPSPGDLLISALVLWPGPLAVFGGNWSILDV